MTKIMTIDPPIASIWSRICSSSFTRGIHTVVPSQLFSLVLLLIFAVGCGGYSSRTAKMRTALDEGNPEKAMHALNQELGVHNSNELPTRMDSDNALLVLDRAT